MAAASPAVTSRQAATAMPPTSRVAARVAQRRRDRITPHRDPRLVTTNCEIPSLHREIYSSPAGPRVKIEHTSRAGRPRDAGQRSTEKPRTAMDDEIAQLLVTRPLTKNAFAWRQGAVAMRVAARSGPTTTTTGFVLGPSLSRSRPRTIGRASCKRARRPRLWIGRTDPRPPSLVASTDCRRSRPSARYSCVVPNRSIICAAYQAGQGVCGLDRACSLSSSTSSHTSSLRTGIVPRT